MSIQPLILSNSTIDHLLQLLQADGYLTVGPCLSDQAIVYGELRTCADLPQGWTDVQAKGTYRLKKRKDQALFGYVVGPHSWKKYLFPPQQVLWQAQRTDTGFELSENPEPIPKYAFIGVRGCELAAIQIQDRVFLQGAYVDPHYQQRREQVLIVAVNCTEPGQTCFCASMDTGPQARQGYDLSLTEMLDEGEPYYLARSGSPKGEYYLAQLTAVGGGESQLKQEQERLTQAAQQMGRYLDAAKARQVLQQNYGSPYWEQVGERCLACTNCTMVCPTCFCSSVSDTTDLTDQTATRTRQWDSCFSLDFTYTGGHPIRQSHGSRYRQWLTHKLSTWHDQFDSSGCVGCGRCITWCPVGIDLTEEITQLDSPTPQGE